VSDAGWCRGELPELIVRCWQCNDGYHAFCVTPPLDSVSRAQPWMCEDCHDANLVRLSLSPPLSLSLSVLCGRVVQ